MIKIFIIFFDEIFMFFIFLVVMVDCNEVLGMFLKEFFFMQDIIYFMYVNVVVLKVDIFLNDGCFIIIFVNFFIQIDNFRVGYIFFQNVKVNFLLLVLVFVLSMLIRYFWIL